MDFQGCQLSLNHLTIIHVVKEKQGDLQRHVHYISRVPASSLRANLCLVRFVAVDNNAKMLFRVFNLTLNEPLLLTNSSKYLWKVGLQAWSKNRGGGFFEMKNNYHLIIEADS
jgi:hypothetical protein